MDDGVLQRFEALLTHKLFLYRELAEQLDAEKATLLRIDMDNLWRIAQRKESLCKEIEAVRGRVRKLLGCEDSAVLELNELLKSAAREHRVRFQRIWLQIIRVKGEIAAKRQENQFYIKDSLQFLDDLIAILAGQSQTGSVYNRSCRLHSASCRPALNGEV